MPESLWSAQGWAPVGRPLLSERGNQRPDWWEEPSDLLPTLPP